MTKEEHLAMLTELGQRSALRGMWRDMGCLYGAPDEEEMERETLKGLVEEFGRPRIVLRAWELGTNEQWEPGHRARGSKWEGEE